MSLWVVWPYSKSFWYHSSFYSGKMFTPEHLNHFQSGFTLIPMMWTIKNKFDADPFNLDQKAVKPGGNESQKTRNKKQNGLAHSRFIVYVTPKQKKTFLDSRIMFLAENVQNSQSTIYLQSHGCVHGLQNEMSLFDDLLLTVCVIPK